MTRSTVTKLAALISFVTAGLIMFSWMAFALGSNLFAQVPAVKFSTAFCLALSSTALFFLDQQKSSRTRQKAVLVSTLVVLLTALLTLSEHLFKTNLGITQWLLPDLPGAPVQGHMSMASAIFFVFLSVVHLFLVRGRFFLLSQVILITGFVILSLVFLVNMAQADRDNISVFRASTLHTSFVFLLLYAGSFFSRPLQHLQFSFEKRMVANFLFILLFLVSVFLAFRGNDQRFTKTSDLVTHTHNVLLKASEVATAAAQLQSSVRGYVLTGDELLIKSFDSAAVAIRRDLQELQTLTKDEALQPARVDTLQQMVSQYVQSRRQIIRQYKKGELDLPQIQNATREGNQTAAEIKARLTAFQQQQNAILQKQRADHESAMIHSARAIILFQALIGLLVVWGFVVVYRNIRKRKNAEADLRYLNETLEERVRQKTRQVVEGERQYHFLMENMQEGIQILGFDWRYRYVNKAFMRQRSSTREDLIGNSLLEIYPGIEQSEVFRVLQRCMEERQSSRFEHTNNKGVFELSIEPVPEGLFILSMDITERKKAEATLKESEARLAGAQKIARLAHWEWNREKGLVDTSGELTALLGGAVHETMNTEDFWQLIHPEDRDWFQKAVQVAFENETGLNLGFRIREADQTIRFLHINSEIQFNPQKEPHCLSGTIQDVSALKRSEDMLQQLNANLEKRAQELRASNAELERFAFVASHDLQEPLRMVSSFLSLLEEETGRQLNEAAREYIRFAVDGAERMKKLVAALLEYSRLGTASESWEPINCNEVLAEARDLLDLSIKETGAVLVVHPLPTVKGIAAQLQQLFQNLISNALKYRSAAQPQIEIGCRDGQGQWIFYVKDNGIGIDPRYFEKIFIIFQRLHEKSRYSGTGIGLAICKKIVEKHGGTIWVESVPGQGCHFYFTIPKTEL